MPIAFLVRLCLLITAVVSGWPASAQSILLDPNTATYGNPWVTPRLNGTSASALDTKVLVTTSALPAQGDFETLGALYVQSRWPGSTGKARKLLAEQAKGMGANVVVESRVWQGLAFPAVVAPQGSGIAVLVKDHELLESLAGSVGTWE
ncbi:hypothetical protein [Ferribacterium limneticum]|uniref:hypothetical protein n=1 Tax=Ferribacterium limneticum TaxID=76259 RepID=UPI001CF8C500|nr:hypothetical protein [Ferribacterium limneticum]UCV21137.1 hypothetical protein KI613_11255 [Ferribacterium limneticum]